MSIVNFIHLLCTKCGTGQELILLRCCWSRLCAQDPKAQSQIGTDACICVKVKHFPSGHHTSRGNQEALKSVCTFDSAMMSFLLHYTFKDLNLCIFFLFVIFWWSFGPGKCDGMDFWFLYHNYISNCMSTSRQEHYPSIRAPPRLSAAQQGWEGLYTTCPAKAQLKGTV